MNCRALKAFSAVLVTAVLTSFCSESPFQNENGEVFAEISNNELLIMNGRAEAIHFAMFEQNLLAVIDWIPQSTDENRIGPAESIRMHVEKIPGYAEEGDKVVLYYWTGDAGPKDLFRSIVLE